MSIWLPIVILLIAVISILLWASIAGRHDGGNWPDRNEEYLPTKEEEIDEA